MNPLVPFPISRSLRQRRWMTALLALCVLLPGWPVAMAKTERRPNVLLIAVDDLNDWTGFLKTNPDVKTPNLDRLAKRSVVFSRAYTASPACNPSRAAVLSGLRPSTTGIYNNGGRWSHSKALVNAVQMPEHFRNNGYYTFWAGKLWHTGEDTMPPQERLEKMWDDMKFRNGGYGPFPRSVGVKHPPLQGAFFDYHIWDGPETDFSDVRNSRRVAEFLKTAHDKPFFAAFGLYRPHNPWTVPRRFFEMYEPEKLSLPTVRKNDLADLPPAGRRMAREHSPNHKELVEAGLWRPLIHAYLASVSFMDEQLGRVLDALEQSPYADNTIVVLWSDHGYHHGQKEHWTKFTLWEMATRSPLIIHVPGMKHAGVQIDTPVSLLDIYPTLVDLAGLPKPASKLEGVSLKKLLENPSHERIEPAITTFDPNNHAVRSGPWRYIRYANGDEELYNIKDDPHEWENLARKVEHREVIRKLAQYLPTTNVPSTEDRSSRKRRTEED